MGLPGFRGKTLRDSKRQFDTGGTSANRTSLFRFNASYLFLALPMYATYLLTSIPTDEYDNVLTLYATARYLIPLTMTAAVVLLAISCLASWKPERFAYPLVLPCVFFLVAAILLYAAGEFGVLTWGYLPLVATASFAVGGSVLLLLWARACSLLHDPTILFYTALSFCLSVALKSVITLPTTPNIVYIVAASLLMISALPLERIFLLHKEECELMHPGTRKPWVVFDEIKKPYLGVVLCVMIISCTWGTSLGTNIVPREAGSTSLGLICQVFAGLLLILLSHAAAQDKPWAATVLGFFPVACVAFLLLSWFLALIDSQHLLVYLNALRDFSSSGLAILFWSALIRGTSRHRCRAFAVGGLFVGSMLVVMLVCMAAGYYLQNAAEYVTPIFALVYLTIVNFNFKGRNTNEFDHSDGMELAKDDESFTARCEELAHLHHLSPREGELLPYLARGHSATYISQELCISLNTVKTHTRRVYGKLTIHTRDDLIALVNTREP